MRVHDHLISVYKYPAVYRTLSRFGLHTLLKDAYWQFRRWGHGTSTRTIDGVSVEMETYSIPTHEERPVLSDLLQRLRSDDVFYDIGTDRGWYSCFAGQVLDEGRIVSFEPHPSRRRVLRRNLKLNGLRESTTIQKQALSNQSRRVEFSYSIQNATTMGEISVDTSRGDSVIERDGLPRPTVMKIDVEGAEQEVLEGMEGALTHRELRAIYIEMHGRIDRFDGSWNEVKTLLEDVGFETEKIHSRGNQEFWRAFRGESGP